MKIQINNRWTGELIIEGDFSTLAELVRDAIRKGLNLSGADLSGANLSGADLSGADLSGANLSGADLSGADLSGADLSGADLSGADLSGADLRGADLRGADLRGADLRGADLRGADLSGADLSGANLRGANLPYIEPIKDLDKQILAAIKNGGKLKMDDWHSCETTHCRGGWAITLHPAGRTIEGFVGTHTAAVLIYNACYPKMAIPDFFTSEEEAMKDIEARAAL